MRNTIKEKSSPTTATSSGQDIQAHAAQSDGDITAPIRPRGEANVGPTKAVQPPSQLIRRPRTPPPRPARHPRVPTAITISPNIRLCRHKSVAVARGVALVNPDEPFLVKVCNFGPDQAIVRKNSILGFAEPFQGPMLAAITEETATQDTPSGEDTSLSDDPVEDVDLSEAPEHLHK